MLRCGLYLPNFGAFGDARTLAALAADAEAAGWDGFFVWDHVARPPPPMDVVDPWVALAAIALATTRMRIGALVTPLPRRRPWQVARATASIDRLSGGRLVFGAGIGSGRSVEWEDLGEETDPPTRGAMLDEGLAVLAGLWAGAPFSFEGAHYRVQQARFLPKPLQTPRIPVWIGGRWPNRRPFRRAARWDGMFAEFPEAGDELAQLREAVDYVRGQRAKDEVFEVAHATAPQHVDLAAFARAGVTWWLARVDPRQFGGSWEGPWPMDAMRDFVGAAPPRRA
jgi:alkanesulfonate monooxygenase SsuD/methylene tetrahydromethanopterin reductase-like flavin-dependent oxidoreductase (luciferase family)